MTRFGVLGYIAVTQAILAVLEALGVRDAYEFKIVCGFDVECGFGMVYRFPCQSLVSMVSNCDFELHLDGSREVTEFRVPILGH